MYREILTVLRSSQSSYTHLEKFTTLTDVTSKERERAATFRDLSPSKMINGNVDEKSA